MRTLNLTMERDKAPSQTLNTQQPDPGDLPLRAQRTAKYDRHDHHLWKPSFSCVFAQFTIVGLRSRYHCLSIEP